MKGVIKVEIVNKSSLPIPTYATIGSSGMDLKTNIGDYTVNVLDQRLGNNFNISQIDHNGHVKEIDIYPNGRYLFPTGIYVSIPKGFEIQIRSRSGNAIKKGLFVLNEPGTIDSKQKYFN